MATFKGGMGWGDLPKVEVAWITDTLWENNYTRFSDQNVRSTF